MLLEFGGRMAMLGRAEALLENTNDVVRWRFMARNGLIDLVKRITGKVPTDACMEVVLDYKRMFEKPMCKDSLIRAE